VLDAYRAYPGRGHLLRLGAAALLGHLTNIHPSGAASMAWHGDPTLLRRDAYSGDYGIGLYGYWRSAAAYIDCHPERGWECMLCDVLQPTKDAAEGAGACSGSVVVAPRDALRRRAYIAPLGLLISVEGGQMVALEYEPAKSAVGVWLARHEAAPSETATIFHTFERVLPPAAVAPHGWLVTCLDVPVCASAWMRDAHVIRLAAGANVTKVRLEPAH